MPDVALLYDINASTNKRDYLLEQPSSLVPNSIMHAPPSSILEGRDIEYYYRQTAKIADYDLSGMPK